jgi:hypothetical protein
MFNTAKRTLTAAVVIAAVSTPSAASARVGVPASPQGGTTGVGICHRHAGRCTSPPSVQTGTTGVGICHRHAGRCTSLAGAQANAPRAHPAFSQAADSQGGFRWGDAGIGAAGMLLLLTAGGVATTASRRQQRRASTT